MEDPDHLASLILKEMIRKGISVEVQMASIMRMLLEMLHTYFPRKDVMYLLRVLKKKYFEEEYEIERFPNDNL